MAVGLFCFSMHMILVIGKGVFISFICGMQRFTKFLLVGLALSGFGCNRSIYDSSTICQLDKENYLSKLEESDDAYILDVRTKKEYNNGHIDGAQSMSILSSFGKQIELLDSSKTVFIYCEAAHRSPFATMKLKRIGFTRIYDLKGGYSVLRTK